MTLKANLRVLNLWLRFCLAHQDKKEIEEEDVPIVVWYCHS